MTASFFLAVDVGTSRVAAATARVSVDGTVTATAFPLGRNADSAPSVIYVGESELLLGDAAARRGIAHPERLIREFKRRIGDDVPILAGDQQFTPEQLYARMVAWVIDTVTEREGRPPAAISVAVPVTWTEFRTELVRSALAREGWRDVELIAEPVAAARHYELDRPLAVGGILAVYDLGGGTFDAVVLRKGDDETLSVVGEPVGIGAFGGSDFDDLVLRHAITAAGLTRHSLTAERTSRVALAALRRECIDAKEALSFDSEAVVPVLIGGANATVRLTRSEFEGLVEAGVARTVEVLAGAFDSAAVDVRDVEAILLTGGSSRIPRVAQLLSERFDRPIAVDADPKAIVALGAARAAADHFEAPVLGSTEDVDVDVIETSRRKKPRGERNPDAVPRKAGRRWFGLGAATAVTGGTLMLAAGVVATVGYPLISGGSSATDPEPSPTTQSSASPEPAAGEQEPTTMSGEPSGGSGAGYETFRESVQLVLAERTSGAVTPGTVPSAAPTPTPSTTPLLSPAAPSERIHNVVPTESTASEGPAGR